MLNALAINCSLKTSASNETSSTDKLLNDVVGELRKLKVNTDIIRAADLNILPGVKSDEGPGDDWPGVRAKIMAADVLVLGTPIWLGQPSSVAKRVLERMDAFLGETDEQGHMPSYGKVAAVAVVGNEDGAHHVCAELFQALNDVGFTIPASGCTYWVGEAMQGKEYKDFKQPPEKIAHATRLMATMAAHLAGVLKSTSYPAID